MPMIYRQATFVRADVMKVPATAPSAKLASTRNGIVALAARTMSSQAHSRTRTTSLRRCYPTSSLHRCYRIDALR